MKKNDRELRNLRIVSWEEQEERAKGNAFAQEALHRLRMKPSWYMYRLLCEAYVRSGEYTNWIDVIKKIKEYLLYSMTQEDFDKYLDSLNLSLELVKGYDKIGAEFDTVTRQIIMKMTPDVAEKIKNADEEKIKSFAYTFWVSFVHEDTHRQQQTSAGDYNIHTNYKDAKLLSWEDDYEKNIEYFDQHVEAAAYGREIGALLSNLYPDESASGVFYLINKNQIKDLYCKKAINIYKHPGMSDGNRRKFFRALYDFLAGNEKDEEEQSSSQ